MAKKKESAPVVPEPPLHVELSDPAAVDLKTIRARFNWNKKQATEAALAHFAKARGDK